MVTAPIPLYSPNDITRVQSRAGGWIASFDFDGACTSTPSLPTIASTNESPSDSSKTTSILTGPFCCNHQYSVTAITTSTGAIAERYAYTAYGQPTILNASGTPLSPQTSTLNSRYSYTGREWDATLALHHFRARWMSPSAGRFLGRDPIGYAGSEWGLYEAFECKALYGVDPLGLQIGMNEGDCYDWWMNPVPHDNMCEGGKCCLERQVGWRFFGHNSHADCKSQCVSAYYAAVAAAGGIGVGVCSGAKNPILAKACTIIGVGIGSFFYGIDWGCDITCSEYQCLSSGPVTKYTVRIKSWFFCAWDYDQDFYKCPATLTRN
jgi:RHS repeat-associated protein